MQKKYTARPAARPAGKSHPQHGGTLMPLKWGQHIAMYGTVQSLSMMGKLTHHPVCAIIRFCIRGGPGGAQLPGEGAGDQRVLDPGVDDCAWARSLIRFCHPQKAPNRTWGLAHDCAALVRRGVHKSHQTLLGSFLCTLTKPAPCTVHAAIVSSPPTARPTEPINDAGLSCALGRRVRAVYGTCGEYESDILVQQGSPCSGLVVSSAA